MSSCKCIFEKNPSFIKMFRKSNLPGWAFYLAPFKNFCMVTILWKLEKSFLYEYFSIFSSIYWYSLWCNQYNSCSKAKYQLFCWSFQELHESIKGQKYSANFKIWRVTPWLENWWFWHLFLMKIPRMIDIMQIYNKTDKINQDIENLIKNKLWLNEPESKYKRFFLDTL